VRHSFKKEAVQAIEHAHLSMYGVPRWALWDAELVQKWVIRSWRDSQGVCVYYAMRVLHPFNRIGPPSPADVQHAAEYEKAAAKWERAITRLKRDGLPEEALAAARRLGASV
jgi:hypothetical protein